MARAKGKACKEAFRRPLRQLKLRQEEEQLCWTFSPRASLANHGFDTDPWLTAKVLADAGLGEVIGVVSISCAGSLSLEPRPPSTVISTQAFAYRLP